MRWSPSLLLPSLFLVGCGVGASGEPKGGIQWGNTQWGDEDSGAAPCAVVGVDPIGYDDATDFGGTAREVFSVAEGTHTAAATYAWGGGSTVTTVVVVDPESVRIQRRSGDTGGGCSDRLLARGTVALQTDDGLLAESYEGPLRVRSPGRVELDRDRVRSFSGTYDPQAHVEEGMQVTSGSVGAEWQAEGPTGSVRVTSEGNGMVSSSRQITW
jgi:hypothetical protein